MESINQEALKSLLLLADAVEARDPYTGGHLWRVSQFSKLLSVKVGLTEDEAIQISLGGYLHDLGKIEVPEEILKKIDKLSEQELKIVQTHPLAGEKIISKHPLSNLVCQPILEHHERLDGKGYPCGLAGDQISFAARIVSISDALDAMTSTRPYRRGMPLEAALQKIREGSGTQFDPLLVEHVCELGEAGDLSHIIGHSADGIPLVTCPHCGPIIAIPDSTQDGDIIYCRACKSRLMLHQKGNTFESVMA